MALLTRDSYDGMVGWIHPGCLDRVHTEVCCYNCGLGSGTYPGNLMGINLIERADQALPMFNEWCIMDTAYNERMVWCSVECFLASSDEDVDSGLYCRVPLTGLFDPDNTIRTRVTNFLLHPSLTPINPPIQRQTHDPEF